MRLHEVGEGQPADDPGSRPPGRLATITSRATTGIHGAVSAVTGILTMVIIVIVWALFALHKLDILSAVSRTPYTGGRPPLACAPGAPGAA